MKRVLIISPYFTPSNLAGVMRARFLAAHLAEFGWEPVVVTVDPAQYEEPNDAAALELLPADLRVERVGAWPAAICRPLGFGDVALRAQSALRRRVAEIIAREKVDVIFCTVLPGYTMRVGAWAKRKLKLPFVLDYQDPWVSAAGASQPRWSKAGLAHWLATRFEPGAVTQADALTAVSAETFATLRTRQLIRAGTPVEIMPIGADENDHVVAARVGKSLIRRTEDGERFVGASSVPSPRGEGQDEGGRSGNSGCGIKHSPSPRPSPQGEGEAVSQNSKTIHLAYVGTITERMLPALRTLLMAVGEVAGGEDGGGQVGRATPCAPMGGNEASLGGGHPQSGNQKTESEKHPPTLMASARQTKEEIENRKSQISERIKVHLVGTSAQPGGEDQLGILKMAEEIGMRDAMELQPGRVPYLDALRTMQDADLLLLPGSTDAHYTASKIFPYWLARRPVLGLFHEASNIVQLAQQLGGVRLVTYSAAAGPATRLAEVTAALRALLAGEPEALPRRNEAAFEPYSARGIARQYAALFDRVVSGGLWAVGGGR